MKVNLTEKQLFSGLYDTIWLNEYSLDDYDFEWTVNRTKYLKEIADIYINFLSNEFPDSIWRLDDLFSPQFYNFNNDKIILEWVSAPENAEQLVNNFLEDIENNKGFTEFEIDKIYYDYLGCEILWEIYEKV